MIPIQNIYYMLSYAFQILNEQGMGDIKVKLYNETPKHRDNFIKLAKDGTYNGTLFHLSLIHIFM